MPKSIVDWFDINNPEHVAAYQHVCDKGVWPPDFLPSKKAVMFPAGWPNLLAATIAEQLLAQRRKMHEVLTQVDESLRVAINTPEETSHVSIPRYSALTLLGRIGAILDPFRKEVQR